jgi:hypothetical protein
MTTPTPEIIFLVEEDPEGGYFASAIDLFKNRENW